MYPVLVEELVRRGFEFERRISDQNQQVYICGRDRINLQKPFVCLEIISCDMMKWVDRTGCMTKVNPWSYTVDVSNPLFELVETCARIVAPCKFIPSHDTLKFIVPESLKKYEGEAK